MQVSSIEHDSGIVKYRRNDGIDPTLAGRQVDAGGGRAGNRRRVDK